MSHVDPGLDEPAQQAAEDVEKDVDDAQEHAKEEEEDYLDPGRWWLASTAFPLIAGTFGPIANAFSICALAIKWRVHIPPGSDEAHGTPIQDPKWLIAVNSISLALALIANVSLLMTMARRVSFSIAQPLTIVGWYIASFLLISLVAVCSSSVFRIQPAEEHALSQAYYYAIIAAGLYFIIASMLVMTLYGAYTGHYPKDFNLTSSQRTLMLQTISFVVYLLLGALIYSYLENWPYLDAVFWADFTLLTVGLGGEFVPRSHTGRALLFPFAIGGIVMVGLVVGSIRSLALERGKQKMSARLLETKRERVLESLDKHEKTVKLGIFEKHDLDHHMPEKKRREQEFHIMRRIQKKADTRRRYVALAMSSLAALLLWSLGALCFQYSEKPQGWSYFASLYFAYTTLLTIGYGDLTPFSNSGKPFFVFWTLVAVPTLTILISNMGDTVIKAFKDLTIWLGALTVLPDEGVGTALKAGVKRLRRGKLYNKDDAGKQHGSSHDAILDRLAMHIEEEELDDAQETGGEGDDPERDTRFFHFILAKEVRKLMKDSKMSPPKQYTYNEWAYYLRLIGQDEEDSSWHRDAQVHHTREPHLPDIGTANGHEEKQWSWLGIRSPLMSNQDEAEWLLERLSLTLESEMRKMQRAEHKRKKKKPPVSMSDYRKGARDSKPREKADPKQLLSQGVSAAEVRRRHPSG
ncbi:voltage-gated potassium channel [Sporormia fimetaria CBS 119925]|uniref:Voltage-gated potassium channel n=1 Tax=Sporormia fimetaria CBS 119925 TaxID=1340428 RepID=A0A6A6V145_9PLEO|nr:voltage-gated potassium channel [Sporormia fimetaria CBS 119925]